MQDSTLPLTLNAPLLVYGLGRSGRGVLRFLGKRGLSAHWTDAKPSPEDLSLSRELGFEQAPTHTALSGYRTVIAAPGVPIDHPDLLSLKAQGAEIMGEAELARRFFPDLPMVGITGTAGKGSTTVLTAQLLRASGLKAREGGNIDPPLLDVIDEAQVVVIELSSFQLERVSHFRPQVAVITNLGVDHLDRHRTEAAYHAAKLNITAAQTPQDILVVPAEFAQTPHLASTQAQVRYFEPKHIALSGGEKVLDVADLPEGIHPANAAAAVLAAEAMLTQLGHPVSVAQMSQTLRAARPVKGRFETVACAGGVRFVNDSIATRSVAVEAALQQAIGPVVWLVGGRDKGAELETLRQAAQGKVRQVIAFGEDGPRMAQQLGLPYQTITYDPTNPQDPMPQAIQTAWEMLKDEVQGTVLLAPIGTSFDLYRDYAVRGEAFTQAAQALCQRVNEQTSGEQTP